MDPFFVCLGVIGAGDALVAAGVWKLLARAASRPRLVRAAGAILGGIAGALIAGPQATFVILKMGYHHEAAGLTIIFAVPFLVPMTTGLAAWLVSDILGGKTQQPLRHALASVIGAVVGAALVFIPRFFLSPAPAWISNAVLMVAPSVGATLAIMISAHRLAPSNLKRLGRG